MAQASKVKVEPVFSENVEALAASSGAIGAAASGQAPRAWQAPRASGWGGDHADVAGMTAPFDRAELNESYQRAVSDPASPGTVGDLVAAVSQIAYVGALERSYRARHASPVRCLVVAAGRRRGHGHPAGVLRGATVGRVTDALAAGQVE